MKNANALIEDIETELRLTATWVGKTRFDARVMAAMRSVPREEFVPASLKACAFDNGPLPIGHGQTISQPYIVALMTDLLGPTSSDTVLEIGAGSGYQAAVLSRVVSRVVTLEIVPELADEAARRLQRLGYANVSVHSGDGYGGWAEQAPYDGIIVTAAAPEIPPPLVAQLKPGRHLVIPVGLPFGHQQLLVGTKQADGTLLSRIVLDVAFVPMTGAFGAALHA